MTVMRAFRRWRARRRREKFYAEMARVRITLTSPTGLPIVDVRGDDAYLIAKYGGYSPVQFADGLQFNITWED